MPKPIMKKKEEKSNEKDISLPTNKVPFKGKGKGKDAHPYKREKEGFPKRNDPAFYTKYAELASNAARIAFNHRNGSHIAFNVGSTTHDINIDPIMVANVIPTPGLSSDMSSGINVAANAAYKVLNRKYRGSASSRYQPADLGIAQFAIMDFFISLAQAERIYGLAMEVRINQRQIPRELLISLGYDADDFVRNYATFRYELNYLITRAKALCLVRGYTLLDHWLFLMANIFKDKDTPRAQYFGYSKPGYWKWNPTYFTTGSALKWVDNSAGQYLITGSAYTKLRTVNSVLQDLNDQLQPLLTDSDIDMICSDILAYFGSEDNNPNVVTLSLLPEEYRVEAIFSEDVMKQIHNMTSISVPVTPSTRTPGNYANACFTELPASIIDPLQPVPDSLYIMQKDGVILFNFTTTLSNTRTLCTSDDGLRVSARTSSSMAADAIETAILDTTELDPSPEQVLEYTRNTVLFHNDKESISGTDMYTLVANSHGSVICVNCYIYLFTTVGLNNRDSNNDLVFTSNELHLHTLNTVEPGNGAIFCASKFDWLPICFKDLSYPNCHVVADLDNYIAINRSTLTPIHDVSILSEFHNPISDVIIQNK